MDILVAKDVETPDLAVLWHEKGVHDEVRIVHGSTSLPDSGHYVLRNLARRLITSGENVIHQPNNGEVSANPNYLFFSVLVFAVSIRASFRHLDTLVLDEADRLLGMGFLQVLKDVVARLPNKACCFQPQFRRAFRTPRIWSYPLDSTSFAPFYQENRTNTNVSSSTSSKCQPSPLSPQSAVSKKARVVGIDLFKLLPSSPPPHVRYKV